MAQPTVPENLPELVHERFEAARESGAITFWPTEVEIIQVNGVPFQLRFCPTLVNKPKGDKPRNGKSFDPFLDPPEAMLVTELLPSHILVLNKFAIVREHFILATKDFKEQTDLLEAEDLGATYACLRAWRAHGKELFAFFNSGEHSGASQPHRHIQLLPVDSMTEDLKDGAWKPIVDTVASNQGLGIGPVDDELVLLLNIPAELPFACFSARIPDDATTEKIFELYISLYDQALVVVQRYNDKQGNSTILSHVDRAGAAIFSYNLGMTDKSIVLCPRRAEGTMILSAGDNPKSIGPISLNGTLLAGTLLVKHEEEWQVLRKDSSQLITVLTGIGIPSSHADQKL